MQTTTIYTTDRQGFYNATCDAWRANDHKCPSCGELAQVVIAPSGRWFEFAADMNSGPCCRYEWGATVLAGMSEGALYCVLHLADFTSDDVADGHVTPITEFDRMVGEGPAEWLADGCCTVCGKTWD